MITGEPWSVLGRADRPGGHPHARLLLLLPALGGDAVPDDAVRRLAGALRARTRVASPGRTRPWLPDGDASEAARTARRQSP
ncbi:hypothetical protein [Streptomyces virginiae]|uniref:hypothetical protein n=1 Tax=Streptomyces virginiae TaxID=1961 RepID=UPI003646944B